MPGIGNGISIAFIKSFINSITGVVQKDDIMLAANFTPASNTAVTTEEILHSLQIGAGLVASNNMLDIWSEVSFTNSTNAKTIRMYINSIDSLSGAVQVGVIIRNALTEYGCNIQRLLPVLSDITVEGSATNTNLSSFLTILNANPAAISVASLSAGFYVIISGKKASAGETLTVRSTVVRNNTL